MTPHRLRELRLYHYRLMVAYRAKARHNEAGQGGLLVTEDFDRKANMHLGFVQVLDTYFTLGDTAEKDNKPDV